MDPRGLAHLACRLLAVYLAAELIGPLLVFGGEILAAPRLLADWPRGFALECAGLALRLAAAVALWLAARPLARWLAPAALRAPARAQGESTARAVIVGTGALVLAGTIADAAHFSAAAWPWVAERFAHRGSALPSGLVAPGAALLLRLVLGIGLIAASRGIACALNEDVTGERRRGLSVRDDARFGELLGELAGAAATLDVKRVHELALSLKSEAGNVARRVVRSSLDSVIAAVEQHRPDFSAAAAADGTVTIVFSDMEGFTAMTQRLGDAAAHKVIKAHNRIVREAVRQHRGQEVELQGDGFLLAFPQAAAALRCTSAIQRDCERYSRRNPDTPIRVRIGVHSGTPIQEGDRFFGITVILAARIAAQARGGETLVSEAVHQQFAGGREFSFDAGRSAELKGLDGTHRMYAVLG